MIAHTHLAPSILFHGTYDGFFLDVVVPIASSISLRSSGDIRGWTAGVSKIIQNHRIDHINPTPPAQVKNQEEKKFLIKKWIKSLEHQFFFKYIFYICWMTIVDYSRHWPLAPTCNIQNFQFLLFSSRMSVRNGCNCYRLIYMNWNWLHKKKSVILIKSDRS